MLNRIPPSFAPLLLQHRKSAGLTQEELARRSGVSRRGISDLERKIIKRPHEDTVTRLADALDLTDDARAAFVAAARRPAKAAPLPPPVDAALLSSLLANGTLGTVVPWVGREAESDHIARFLGGQVPPILLLAGEPGIGKSRMLYELGQRGMAAQWRVVVGTCGRRHAQEPYAPWPFLLRRALGATPPKQRERELRGCGWLHRLVPDLIDAPPAVNPTSPLHERRMLVSALRRYLRQIAGRAGTLVLLDDLQWAAPDALDILAELWEEADGAVPLRLAVAYRTDPQMTPALADWIAEREHRQGVRPLRLRPLSSHEAQKLLERAMQGRAEDDNTADWRGAVVERAAGNPFYLLSYAQERIALPGAADVAAIPPPVADAIRSRLAVLPNEVRRLLTLVALADPRIDATTLARAARRTPEHVLRVLEEALRMELVVQDKKHLRFAHDLIRDVLIEDLTVARRRLLHAHLAAALEREIDAPPRHLATVLAYHFSEAGNGERALPYAIRAGDEAENVFAHRDAERWYRLALTIAQEHGDHRTAARMAAKIGGVLVIIGRFAEALTLSQEAFKAFSAIGDDEGIYDAAIQIALYYIYSTPEEGTRVLQPIIEQVREDMAPALLAKLYAYHANCYTFATRYHKGYELARQSLDIAERAGEADALAMARYVLGHASLWLGRLHEARTLLQKAAVQFRNDQSPEHLGHTYDALHDVALVSADFRTADHTIAKLLVLAHAWESPHIIFHEEYQAGIFAWFAGKWSQARHRLTVSRDIVKGNFLERYPLAWLALLDRLEGAAAATDEEARIHAMIQAGPVLRFDRDAYLALGRSLLVGKRHKAVIALLAPLIPLTEDEISLDLVPLLPLLAQAHLARGATATAAALVERALRHARAMSHQLALSDALRVAALLALREGRWPDAEAALKEALSIARDAPYPYAEAQVRAAMGELARAHGGHAAAHAHWQAAEAICQSLGEHPLRRQIASFLRRK